jgi:hypothetical protein
MTKSEGKGFQGGNVSQVKRSILFVICRVLLDLTIVVSSIAINNIEKRWITLEFDDFRCVIVESKTMHLWLRSIMNQEW